ncbi:hypothetical protein QAD02_002893 [Eretmocerus hayati]|uniref:Uncharacterized protein n=1 Tax=Eretmocerus hayati TaxID=131215 RepID=A0ACC2NK54_9HYME|nr:hypothetical protein QAD02_002893 [Eretmocerus hayati]
MFGTRTGTGNATVSDTGGNGLEDSCFDTGRNEHGPKQTVLGMFGIWTETGNATILDTGEDGLEDLCFDEDRNGHGRKRIVLLISSTQTETGNALILVTGKTGLEDFCSDTGRDKHGRKWTELGIFPIRAETGSKPCALIRIETETGKNGQCSSFPTTRTGTGNAIISDTGKNGREDSCIDTGRNGQGRKRTTLCNSLTRAETSVKICASTRVETDTDGNKQRFSFFPHGQNRVMLS